jgi:hypothetical protein
MENDKELLKGAVRVKSYRVQARGKRGRVVALPKDYLDELHLGQGDRLVFFRRPDSDVLMIAPERV